MRDELYQRANISIHALHEESDHIILSHQIIKITISIHALHEESDMRTMYGFTGVRPFQSTLSMRRATLTVRRVFSIMLFQSTLSMRRATYYTAIHTRYEIFQSTLSMRRATYAVPVHAVQCVISIHALHEESDRAGADTIAMPVFQSTLSMRRATLDEGQLAKVLGDFNPRSP